MVVIQFQEVPTLLARVLSAPLWKRVSKESARNKVSHLRHQQRKGGSLSGAVVRVVDVVLVVDVVDRKREES